MRRRRGGPEDLLAYREDGGWRDVRSDDVNAYIQEQIGERLLGQGLPHLDGTVLAASALAGEPPPESKAAAKRTIAAAVKQVAEALGNTPAVCRRSYIDPRVFDRYRDGVTIELGPPRRGDDAPAPGPDRARRARAGHLSQLSRGACRVLGIAGPKQPVGSDPSGFSPGLPRFPLG